MTTIGVTGISWLRRRDPGLLSIKRAARVALVACTGFYVCRYGLGNPTMATYALFGTVALGALSQIPGSPVQRARTLVAVAPVGAVLVCAGTLLSVTNWSAALGMFVLGFLVSYVGVGGPRLVGLATGVQLLYILPCFPPYDPGSLGYRLIGLALAIGLLATAELLLWPDPAPVPYRQRLGGVVEELAACLDALARAVDGDPAARAELAERLPAAAESAEAIRPSRLAPASRPASASRRDRALSQASTAVRLILARTNEVFADRIQDPLHSTHAADLFRRAADMTRSAAGALCEECPPPDPHTMATALTAFRAARLQDVPDGVHPDRLRLGALALTVGDGVKELATAVGIAQGTPAMGGTDGTDLGPFWYARHGDGWLWWHRLREHLTPRSVYFQGALRLAVALAVARLLAGYLDLSHGFWVLLATLTLLRTSAADTRSALRPALIGTTIGAVLAGGLLVVGAQPQVYVIALPLVMVVGFAAGPVLGPGPAQALFTVVIAMIFAQVAPVDWRLAEARVLDVALGAAIGLLIGLFAWPRGGSGELHRATANALDASSAVVRETVRVLAHGEPPGAALSRARQRGQLAEASYALYQTERHAPSIVDWQATLGAGRHAVRGAEALLRECPTGRLLACARQLDVASATVAVGYQTFADGLRRGVLLTVTEPPLDAEDWPTDLGTDLYHLADLRVWLASLGSDLRYIATRPTQPNSAPAQRSPAPIASPAPATG